MIKDRKKMGWGKVIPQLFCCASTVALFFRHGLALSYSWPAATGRSGVTCNQCHFEAKDETLLLLPVPVNEETRVLTSTICHKSGTDISFLKKDSPILNHIIYRFFFYLRTGLSSNITPALAAWLKIWISIHSPYRLTSC